MFIKLFYLECNTMHVIIRNFWTHAIIGKTSWLICKYFMNTADAYNEPLKVFCMQTIVVSNKRTFDTVKPQWLYCK